MKEAVHTARKPGDKAKARDTDSQEPTGLPS